jgi:hypothetical protein
MLLLWGLCTNWKVEVHPFSTSIYSQCYTLLSLAYTSHSNITATSYQTSCSPCRQGWCPVWSVLFTNTFQTSLAWENLNWGPMTDNWNLLRELQKQGRKKLELHVNSHCVVSYFSWLRNAILWNGRRLLDNLVGKWYQRTKVSLLSV